MNDVAASFRMHVNKVGIATMLEDAVWRLRHEDHCEFDEEAADADDCTCGLSKLRDDVAELKEEIKGE